MQSKSRVFLFVDSRRLEIRTHDIQPSFVLFWLFLCKAPWLFVFPFCLGLGKPVFWKFVCPKCRPGSAKFKADFHAQKRNVTFSSEDVSKQDRRFCYLVRWNSDASTFLNRKNRISLNFLSILTAFSLESTFDVFGNFCPQKRVKILGSVENDPDVNNQSCHLANLLCTLSFPKITSILIIFFDNLWLIVLRDIKKK